MKAEIEIKKSDLNNIFCAALRYYYHDLRSRVSEEEPNGCWRSEIIDNLYEIRSACDTMSYLCDLIEGLDGVENDNERGAIRFGDSKENGNEHE